MREEEAQAALKSAQRQLCESYRDYSARMYGMWRATLTDLAAAEGLIDRAAHAQCGCLGGMLE